MSVTFTNTRIVYIKNGFNKATDGTIKQYPGATTTYEYLQTTGWHLVPNQLYQDLMTFKNWYNLITKNAYFCPKHLEVTIQNLIPLTDDLSIAQDTTFMSFNNTIYAVTYQDDIYETPAQHFQNPSIHYREGLNPQTNTKIYLPIYVHHLPARPGQSDQALLQAFWDPLTKADRLGELRPGKNAVSYSWTRNPADNDKWYNTSMWCTTSLTGDLTDSVWNSTYENQNWANQPITPGEIYKQDPRNPLTKAKKSTEYKYYWKYPIPNMFIKMIPIFNTKNTLLKHEGQVVITTKFTLDVKPDKYANNMPRYDYHSTDLNQVYCKVKNPNFGTFKLATATPNRNSQPPYTSALETTDKAIVIPEA